MNDFKVLLGLEFFRETKTGVMPSTGTLAMLGNKPCMIPVLFARVGEKSLSALQAKIGLKRRETTYLAVLNWQNTTASHYATHTRRQPATPEGSFPRTDDGKYRARRAAQRAAGTPH